MKHPLYGHEETEAPKAIEEFTNVALARFVLRYLWHEYDRQDVSRGKDERSRILEAALRLMPLAPLTRYVDEVPLRDLTQEAGMRELLCAVSYRSALTLPHLPTLELVTLLLHRLKEYYEENLRRYRFAFPKLEIEILDLALMLLPWPPEFEEDAAPPTEEVIREAERRFNHKVPCT